MASASSTIFHSLSIHSVHNASPASAKAHPPKQHAQLPPSVSSLGGRRHLLLLLTASMTLSAMEQPSRAEDIGLFGLRKKLKKVEEEAEEFVKEGFEAADNEIVAAEKGLEAAEKGVVAAEEELKTVLSYGGLAQAGVVAAAELVGVVVATSIVNGILGPEAQNS